MLDEHIEAFVIYLTFLLIMAIKLARKTQIILLLAKKVQILIKYLDFLYVFFEEKALILPAAIDLNKHAIGV